MSQQSELALSIRDLVAGYTPEVDILRGANLQVARGEIVTVLGPNGAGKSTLIKTIAGLVPVRSGDVQLFGQSLVGEAAHRMVREHGEDRASSEPAWRLVVAPVKGTVALAPHGLGDSLDAGCVVATVSSLRDQHEVVSAHGGQVVEWLVEEGDPVSPGQPLLRLHPTEQPA